MKIYFNPKAYRDLIKTISAHYSILNFYQSVEAMRSSISGVCCLRHDIDYCMESALDMALLEKDSGIKSSYFFLVDSSYYNVLSERSEDIIHQISEMGHEIALHFDISRYEFNTHEAVIKKYVSFLEDIVGKNSIKSLSFHTPGIFGMERIPKDIKYCSYLNTYSNDFNNIFSYASDSLCAFRDEHIMEKIQNKSFANLHLLIHPVWWSSFSIEPDKKIELVFEEAKKRNISSYYDILKQYQNVKSKS